MKKLILLLLILSSCSEFPWRAVEDGVSGEIKVAETIANDLQNAPSGK